MAASSAISGRLAAEDGDDEDRLPPRRVNILLSALASGCCDPEEK
jgi:hypothetical protein